MNKSRRLNAEQAEIAEFSVVLLCGLRVERRFFVAGSNRTGAVRLKPDTTCNQPDGSRATRKPDVVRPMVTTNRTPTTRNTAAALKASER